MLSAFRPEMRGCFEKLTRLISFSQTSDFREAKASESGGASCVYQDFRYSDFDAKTWVF